MDALSQEMHPIRETLIEVSPVDLSSKPCVEKLQSVLTSCQQKVCQHHSEDDIITLLKYGLQKVIMEGLQAFTDQSDNVNAGNESLLDALLETINVLSENSSKACELIVPDVSMELLEMLNNTIYSFQQKMEILKTLNIMLEYSTFIIKEKLLLKSSFLDSLKKLFNLILHIGDYEFQVGAIECLFRLIPKKVRNLLCPKIISDPRHLATFLLIKDSNFETDCRTFLNNLNSSFGERKRVMSIPCISVQLGSRVLEKPSDPGYNEFWVDFNYGSNRITIFCEQDSLLQCSQSQEDDLWETVSILHSDITSYIFTESNHTVSAMIELTGEVVDVFSQMRNIEGNQIVITADVAYNLPLAVQRTLNISNLTKKVSCVCEPLDITLFESSQSKPSRKPKPNNPEVIANSQMSVESNVTSASQRRPKMSVPYEPMSTPANSVCLDDRVKHQPSSTPSGDHNLKNKQAVTSENRIQKVKASLAIAEIGSAQKKSSFQSPKPTNNKSKKKIKTPVVVVEQENKGNNSNKTQNNANKKIQNTSNSDNKFGCKDVKKTSFSDNISYHQNINSIENDDNIIPDSLPSQKTVDKKQTNRKLREVDSGICLVEPDQPLSPSNRNIPSKTGEKMNQVPCVDSVKPGPKVSRSQLLTVEEARKMCVESDDNISDISSVSLPSDNGRKNIPENLHEISLTYRDNQNEISKCSAFDPDRNHDQGSKVKVSTPASENNIKSRQVIEKQMNERSPSCDGSKKLQDGSSRPKYGMGKGKSLPFPKPLSLSPMHQKQPLRYSLQISQGGKIGAKSTTCANSEVMKSQSESNVISRKEKETVSSQRKTRQQSKDVKKSASESQINDNQNKSGTCKEKQNINDNNTISNVKDHQRAGKKIDSASMENKGRAKIQNKKETSETIEETSTRVLRRRKADENKTVEEKVTLYHSQSAEDLHFQSPKKISKKENKPTHSAKVSSTKKAFFIETKTMVTNSYRRDTEKLQKQTHRADVDPYKFDFDSDSDDGKSVNQYPTKSKDKNDKNKIFKCNKPTDNRIKTSKSDSNISEKTKKQSLWQQQRNSMKPYHGFSDDDDDDDEDVVDAEIVDNHPKNTSSKLKHHSTSSTIQSSKSLPNMVETYSCTGSQRAPRQAKLNKVYKVDSESDDDLEIGEDSAESKLKIKIEKNTDKVKTGEITRDSSKYIIFNRDSWGTTQKQKTPIFDRNISKSMLPTPSPSGSSALADNNNNTNSAKTGTVETFTAISTGLILDTKDKVKSKKHRSKSLDTGAVDLSSRKSVDGRSEVSWLEKKSSGKRKKFKKTYKKSRSRSDSNRRRDGRLKENKEEELILSSQSSSEDEEIKTKKHTKDKTTPKIRTSTSTTPKIVTPAGLTRKVFSPLDIRIGQTPKTPKTPGLPSLCIVSEDSATAPSSVQKNKLKTHQSRKTKYLKNEDDEEDENIIVDTSQPISAVSTTSQSTNSGDIQPTTTQILSLEQLMKIPTPKHIKEVIEEEDDGDDEDEEDDDDDDDKENVDPLLTGKKANSTLGLISGPSSRVRLSKSALKRKYSHIKILDDEDDDEDETSGTSNNSQDANNSSFIPRKLFKTETPEMKLKVSPVMKKRQAGDRKDVREKEVRYPVSLSTDDEDGEEEEEEEEESLKTGVTAVVRTFGVDIQNQLKAKRKQLDNIAQSTLKSSHKMVSNMWTEQKHKRKEVLENYQKKILQELKILEKEINMMKDEEERTMNFYAQQMKFLKTCRDSQEKRIKNLSRNQDNLEDDLEKLDEEGHHQQQKLKTVLKSDLTALQQKLLKQTQQYQLTNVKKFLQNLIL